ncbi:hypothetical protein [Chitiniphilus eburneus]|uniref:hypothetical protein n=1 Tax=Chitiniphilus eburneus TaxID=2571148 RepID=UPI0035D07374
MRDDDRLRAALVVLPEPFECGAVQRLLPDLLPRIVQTSLSNLRVRGELDDAGTVLINGRHRRLYVRTLLFGLDLAERQAMRDCCIRQEAATANWILDCQRQWARRRLAQQENQHA